MRLRGVRTLVPEGTLTCRTHTTQHELSAVAPNVQSVQLFASLGFADIRVGATSADIAVEVVRTCTHAGMYAASCDACTKAPAALKPSRNCANQICWRSRRLLPLHCRFAGLTQSTLHMQRAAHATKSRRASPVSAAALPQVGLPARWSSVDCRCMCAVGNGRRVTNRSSRLIIVVYSPSAAPDRSCSSGTQRSFWALILRCVCLAERAQWVTHRDRPIAAARPRWRQPS